MVCKPKGDLGAILGEHPRWSRVTGFRASFERFKIRLPGGIYPVFMFTENYWVIWIAVKTGPSGQTASLISPTSFHTATSAPDLLRVHNESF
jgi:hypothetical protein